MNLWVIKDGVRVVFKSFLDIPVDKDLVSGLLSALNQFVFSEFNQPIDSINMGGYKWVYDSAEEGNLLFVASDKEGISIQTLRSRLIFVKQVFLKQFLENEQWIHWNGNLDMFESFENDLEKYYYNWQAAESLESIAEFFDYLRIFQELFSHTKNVIKSHSDPNIREIISELVKDFFENFKREMQISRFKELSKITYDHKNGFYIFDIDPSSCDIIQTKRFLKQILVEYVNTIKATLGIEQSLQFFNNCEIFQYISHNLLILIRFDLVDFLFRLYLLPE